MVSKVIQIYSVYLYEYEYDLFGVEKSMYIRVYSIPTSKMLQSHRGIFNKLQVAPYNN